MTRKMTSNRHLAGLAALSLALASCGGEKKEPAPQPASTDEPRSIFREEPKAEALGAALAPELPPLETTISFADGTAELTEAARGELATVLESDQLEAGGSVVLGGHSDAGGSDAANLRASQNRAEAVRDFLIANGVAEGRITVIAFGEQNPVQPNALPDGSPNEEGRAANRRVDITVTTAGNAAAQGAREQTLIETLTRPEPGKSGAPGVIEPKTE